MKRAETTNNVGAYTIRQFPVPQEGTISKATNQHSIVA